MPTKPDQIEKARSFLKRMREAVAEMGVYPRVPPRVLFDSVALGTLSKAFSVADAALVLIDTGHDEEAFGLVRSVVECGLNLRFMTADPDSREERAKAFAWFFFKERQYWLFQANEFIKDKALLDEMNHEAARLGIVPDSKPASEHWSGLRGFVWRASIMDHPLDGTTYGLSHRKIEYAAEYHHTSAYVHCSMHALEGFFPTRGGVYQPVWKPVNKEQQGLKAIYTIVTFIHLAARYAMFGMMVERRGVLDEIRRETIAELDPVARLHRPDPVFRKVYF